MCLLAGQQPLQQTPASTQPAAKKPRLAVAMPSGPVDFATARAAMLSYFDGDDDEAPWAVLGVNKPPVLSGKLLPLYFEWGLYSVCCNSFLAKLTFQVVQQDPVVLGTPRIPQLRPAACATDPSKCRRAHVTMLWSITACSTCELLTDVTPSGYPVVFSSTFEQRLQWTLCQPVGFFIQWSYYGTLFCIYRLAMHMQALDKAA